MKELGTQLITGKSLLYRKAFDKVENYIMSKPKGGLWSSTYTPNEKYGSDWVYWCSREDFEIDKLKFGLTFGFKKDIRIFEVDSLKDLQNLKKIVGTFSWMPYRLLDGNFSEELKNYLIEQHESYIDFEKAVDSYDVIHLTSNGERETRYTLTNGLYGWDCESCLTLNFDAVDLNSVKKVSFE